MPLLNVRFHSRTIRLSMGATVLLPDRPEAWETPPAILYLLHGLSGDHTSWVRRSSLERYLQDYPLAVVMPEVHKSFYCDMAHGSDYWTFIADELPELVQRWFKVTSDPARTFVAGLSMGGYGAFKLALGRPNQYAAAASLSGALDLAAHTGDEWDETHARTYHAVFDQLDQVAGSKNDLIAQLKKLTQPPSTLFYTCVGTEDYLYNDSISFRSAAQAAGLNLLHEEGPGAHDWDFWDQWIQRVLAWLPVEKIPDSEI